MTRIEILQMHFSDFIKAVRRSIYNLLTGSIWDFLGNALMYLSIAIYVLAPIFDYYNMLSSGFNPTLNWVTSFRAVNIAGGISGMSAIAFFLLDWLKEGLAFGNWYRPRAKYMKIIVMAGFVIGFFILYMMAKNGLMGKLFGVVRR